MYFKPIDEMALRHLFSSKYGEYTLKMSYLGPVLNARGNRQESPDCFILDKRDKSWRIRSCEFKFEPCDKSEFAHNGQFDLAIVWNIKSPANYESLSKDLLIQNGCREIIVLNQESAFNQLDEYHIPKPSEYNGVGEVEKVILESVKNNAYPTAYAAYIAAKIYPYPFRIDKMVDVLANRFAEVRQMQPKGRANVVTKLIQTKPNLFESKHFGVYCWTRDINHHEASKAIERIIRINFYREVPDSKIITEFRTAVI